MRYNQSAAAPTAAGASPRPTEKKPEKVELIMRLCERCSERISDRYYLEPRERIATASCATVRNDSGAGVCGLCGREGAAAYAVMPRFAKRQTGSNVTGKDMRARWREPWRER